jgi:hypothetical protein
MNSQNFSKDAGNDKNFNYSKWGFIIAFPLFLISAGLGIYQTFVYERKPQIRFEIITNEEILTFDENLAELEIKYNGIDLALNKKNLSVITLIVENYGKAGILKSDYDLESPWGFEINGGELTKVEYLGATDFYYFENFLNNVDSNSVVFNHLIMDPKSFFYIKCIIINDNGIKPTISPFGKIANVEEMKILDFEFREKTWFSYYKLILLLLLAISTFYLYIKLYFKIRAYYLKRIQND